MLLQKHFRGHQGGGPVEEKRGEENLTKDTVRFPPPLRVSALFFLYKNPRLSRPEAFLGGVQKFWDGALSYLFLSP